MESGTGNVEILNLDMEKSGPLGVCNKTMDEAGEIGESSPKHLGAKVRDLSNRLYSTVIHMKEHKKSMTIALAQTFSEFVLEIQSCMDDLVHENLILSGRLAESRSQLGNCQPVEQSADKSGTKIITVEDDKNIDKKEAPPPKRE